MDSCKCRALLLFLNLLIVLCQVDNDVLGPKGPLQVEVINPIFTYPVVLGALPYVGPAYDSAMSDIRRKYPSINLTLTRIVDHGARTCPDWDAQIDFTVSSYIYGSVRNAKQSNADVTAFILPGCTEVARLATLAKQWDILFITSVASIPELRDRERSPTWITTTVNSEYSYTILYIHLMQRYNWTSVTMVSDQDSNPFFDEQAKAVRNGFVEQIPGVQLDYILIYSSGMITADYMQILQHFNRSGRGKSNSNVKLGISLYESTVNLRRTEAVLLYFGHSTPLRSLMLAAGALGMTDGNYLYITMRALRHDYIVGNSSWKFGDSYDQQAKAAYRSLLIIEPDESVYGTADISEQLASKWREQSHRRYNFTYASDEILSPHPAASYSALMIFAQVMNGLYSSNVSIDYKSGRELAKLFLNRTFALRTGPVSIDECGERIPLLTIRQWDPALNMLQLTVLMMQYPQKDELTDLRPVDWLLSWPPPSKPFCGYRGEAEVCRTHSDKVKPRYLFALGIFMFVGIVAGVMIKRRLFEISIHHLDWKLDQALLRLDYEENGFDSYFMQCRYVEKKTPAPFPFAEIQDPELILDNGMGVGLSTYDRHHVWLTLLESTLGGVIPKQRLDLIFLKELKELAHINVNKFHGVCFWKTKKILLVSNFCARGSLCYLFEILSLDQDFQTSLISDLLEGMIFIHESHFKLHGHLTSWTCLIDGHFTLKIGNLGYRRLRNIFHRHPVPILDATSNNVKSVPWIAPELLRNPTLLISQSADVYAVGIVINHIVTMTYPYADRKAAGGNKPIDLAKSVASDRSNSIRPIRTLFGQFLPLENIIRRCWDEDPNARPTVKTVQSTVRRALGILHTKRQNLIETVLNRLQRYANELNSQVYDRTKALIEERKNCDQLLKEMLPSLVIEKLRCGDSVMPEMFESVTILFSEIGNFDILTSSLSPNFVFIFLNEVYAAFDEYVAEFDVYKVETIRDSYMVASGLPVRNDGNHVKEICGLACVLLITYQHFVASTPTSLRVGIHSGPCVAGIVGRKIPRYCLFGDTINTANRMLSHGANSRIHLSQSTAALLTKFPEYQTISRGPVAIKGKGSMVTFWLKSRSIDQVMADDF